MSNYLKKLAFVHNAMRKLAMEKLASLPGQMPTAHNPAPRMATGSTVTPAPVAPAPVKAPRQKRYQKYSDDQLRQNIDNFQNQYLQQYADINGYDTETAKQRLMRKGRWYKTDDMAKLRGRMENERRLRRMAEGRMNVDNLKWKVPIPKLPGQKTQYNKGLSYWDAWGMHEPKRMENQEKFAPKPAPPVNKPSVLSRTNPWTEGAYSTPIPADSNPYFTGLPLSQSTGHSILEQPSTEPISAVATPGSGPVPIRPTSKPSTGPNLSGMVNVPKPSTRQNPTTPRGLTGPGFSGLSVPPLNAPLPPVPQNQVFDTSDPATWDLQPEVYPPEVPVSEQIPGPEPPLEQRLGNQKLPKQKNPLPSDGSMFGQGNPFMS